MAKVLKCTLWCLLILNLQKGIAQFGNAPPIPNAYFIQPAQIGSFLSSAYDTIEHLEVLMAEVASKKDIQVFYKNSGEGDFYAVPFEFQENILKADLKLKKLLGTDKAHEIYIIAKNKNGVSNMFPLRLQEKKTPRPVKEINRELPTIEGSCAFPILTNYNFWVDSNSIKAEQIKGGDHYFLRITGTINEAFSTYSEDDFSILALIDDYPMKTFAIEPWKKVFADVSITKLPFVKDKNNKLKGKHTITIWGKGSDMECLFRIYKVIDFGTD